MGCLMWCDVVICDHAQRRHGVRRLHDRGDAHGREAARPVEPGGAVGAEVVEQIPAVGEQLRTRDEITSVGSDTGTGGCHRRVPVISWAAPAPSVRCATRMKPAVSTICTSCGCVGRYAVDAGR